MKVTKHIANHLREVYFGVNWTTVNLKDTLSDVTWQEAVKHIHSFNTIAALIYHINYYVGVALNVLQGNPLNASDKYSFDCPVINSQEDWEKLLNRGYDEVESISSLIEQMPENKLEETFIDKKYGNYYRNLHGIIEHAHYHLGQIVLIKKLLREEEKQIQ